MQEQMQIIADNERIIHMEENNVSQKRIKFVELANNRTNKILSTLKLLGNLSNTRAYEYSKQDVDAIFKAIEEMTAEQKKRFNEKNSSNDKKFELKL